MFCSLTCGDCAVLKGLCLSLSAFFFRIDLGARATHRASNEALRFHAHGHLPFQRLPAHPLQHWRPCLTEQGLGCDAAKQKGVNPLSIANSATGCLSHLFPWSPARASQARQQCVGRRVCLKPHPPAHAVSRSFAMSSSKQSSSTCLEALPRGGDRLRSFAFPPRHGPTKQN